MLALDYNNPWVVAADGAGRKLHPLLIALVAALASAWLWFSAKIPPPLPMGEDLASMTFARLITLAWVLGPMVLVACLLGLLVERRPRTAGGMNILVSALVGLAIGALAFGAAFAIADVTGVIDQTSSPSGDAASIAVAAILMLLLAMGEEVFFRGWLQPLLSARLGPWTGLVVTAAFFAFTHGLMHGMAPLAWLNIGLAGLLFGLLAMRTGGLTAPILAHFAWNFIEANVVGMTPNPGVDGFGSLLDFDLVGQSLMSGGADELNGSPAETAALLLAVVVLMFAGLKRRP